MLINAINSNQTKSYEIHLQNCYQFIQLWKTIQLWFIWTVCIAISCTLLDFVSFNPITYSFEHAPSTICTSEIKQWTASAYARYEYYLIGKNLPYLLSVQNPICAQLLSRFFWIATRTKMATTNHKTTIYARKHSYFVEFRLEFSSLKLENKM